MGEKKRCLMRASQENAPGPDGRVSEGAELTRFDLDSQLLASGGDFRARHLTQQGDVPDCGTGDGALGTSGQAASDDALKLRRHLLRRFDKLLCPGMAEQTELATTDPDFQQVSVAADFRHDHSKFSSELLRVTTEEMP